ncbi:MAG TPA: SDR family oxidoreductase [Acidimicrobiia bacterium]|nr:SDR family oxidoreductase [Acidimicrobiia bacterium]
MSISIDLGGQVVLVTGATGGIGRGIARRFHAAGATVAIHHRARPREAEALASELPGSLVVSGDVTDPDARLVEQVVEQAGRITGLVNNAGIQPLADMAEVDEDAWRAMIETNVTAAHRLSQVAAAHMSAGGWITHIASIEGTKPAPAHGHYAVSKAALIMHARAAALEWGSRGIRVNTVSPGLIDRPGLDEAWPEGVARWKAAAPLERLGTPDDIGDACVFLASDLARWVTGIDLVVDGGVSTHPTW